MDILTILLSAFGGIILWNLFVPTKKKSNVYKVAPKDDPWLIRSALLESFGTTDIPAALEYAKKIPASEPDPWLIKSALLNTFGTTDLDYVFEHYMSKENSEQFKKQLQC
jgi:hypothetical protein